MDAVYATVDPANRPSVRVLEKAGLRRDGTVHSDERLLHRYVLTAAELTAR